MNRITLIAIALFAGAARAYEPEVHWEISREAADRSNLDVTLRDRFGEPFGLDTFVNVHSLRDWIGQGGFEEDNPSRRCINHFHNPLAFWANAGFIGVSSIYWQQANNLQGSFVGGGDWSWPKARERYRTYLFSPNPNVRTQALADIMRGLGQLAHLIQDAHSPPHTRADPHRLLDGYEQYTNIIRNSNRSLFEAILHTAPVRPEPGIFTPTGSFPAPSRIARLIDSDTFGGFPDTYNTSGLMGAAEYTNGGYLSDDTVFRDFAMPRKAAIDPVPTWDYVGGSIRQRNYYRKVGDGDQINHFVAEGTLAQRLNFSYGLASFILDDRTYADAAFKLVPRAVGYSAALFDYFFREQLEVVAPDRHVYAAAAYDPSTAPFGMFTKIKAKVRRKPGPDEDLGPGTLTAIVRYRYLDGSGGFLGTDSFKEPDAPIRVQYDQSISKPIPVPAVLDSFIEREFDFSESRIPVNAVDVRLFVVFQGKVGAEDDATAIGIRDMAEPDPVDYVNASDWECYNGTLYHVADRTQFPDLNSRDVDGNHTIDLFAPYFEQLLRLKTSNLDAIQLPDDSNFDMRVVSIDGGFGAQTARVVILQDKLSYAVAASNQAVFAQVGGVSSTLALFGFGAVINNIINHPIFGVVHQYTGNYSYRGKIGFHDIVLITQATLPCFPRTSELKPDATYVPAPPVEVTP